MPEIGRRHYARPGAGECPTGCDVRFTPESGHSLRPSECPLWADFVVEVGLEGRVGWADDFLRSRQGQRFAPARYGAAAGAERTRTACQARSSVERVSNTSDT